MSAIAMTILLLAGLGTFAAIMVPRIRLLLRAPAAGRMGQWGERLSQTLRYAVFQFKMPRDIVPGIAHIFIYVGFLVLALRTVTLFVRAYVPGFEIPGIIGNLYVLKKDIIWVLVLAGVLYGLWRRLGPKETRVGRSWEGVFVLLMILMLGITDMVYDAAEILQGVHPATWNPLGGIVARPFAGASPAVVTVIGAVAYWLHCALILVFLNFLPLGKHFHIITSFFNVFFASLKPRGSLDAIDLEKAEKYGIATTEDLTLSQILNLYSCTECGRCAVYCPTVLTKKPLEHRQLNLDLKAALYRDREKILGAKKADHPQPIVAADGPISADTIWACTTCFSCEEECPVLIENVERIIQLRQNKVLAEGDAPPELARAFKGMENSGNPWGLAADSRADWAEGLGIPIMADWAAANAGKEPPLLFWVGCAGSYDPRVKKVTIAMVKILRAAGVDFAILGSEETCTGDSARRAGNEYLFQMLATQNIETLRNYGIRKILTFCPHCYHTLKVDYRDFGGVYDVVHHTTFINDLVRTGRLKLEKPVAKAFSYHDSCYLGRYHDIYGAPREVIRSIPGAAVEELPRHHSRSVCCGAGGARFWLEEKVGTRINHHRAEEAISSGAKNIASACPFCLTMLSDALKDKGKDEEIGSQDIAEIVAASITS